MQIIYIQPAELKPYRDNPRKNDRATDAVAARKKGGSEII